MVILPRSSFGPIVYRIPPGGAPARGSGASRDGIRCGFSELVNGAPGEAEHVFSGDGGHATGYIRKHLIPI
jgi:hypothetical protein